MIPNKLFVYDVYTNGKVSSLMKFFIKYLQQIFPTIYQSSLVSFVGNKVKRANLKTGVSRKQSTSYAHVIRTSHPWYAHVRLDIRYIRYTYICYQRGLWLSKISFFVASATIGRQIFVTDLCLLNFYWKLELLNLFLPSLPFWSPWKHQKIFGFLIFSGGLKSNIGKKRVTCSFLVILL